MKTFSKILLGSLLLTGMQFAFSGCETDGYASGGVYYGGGYRDPWFRDDRWMDGGHRWYGGENRGHTDVYISPPRLPAPPRIHLP